MVKVRQLSKRPEDWDNRIRKYPGKTLFHESAWHKHLLDIHPSGTVEYFEIVKDGQSVGLHCGIRVTKLGLSIHGSPLGGTGTNHMGPLVSSGVDVAEVIRALSQRLGVRGWMHLELNNPILPREVMAKQGFEVHEGITNLCPLPTDQEGAWAMMKGTARNRIRKARKNGLEAEVSFAPTIPDLYFSQLEEVYRLQDLALPFPVDRPRSLFRRLLAAERILPVQVLHEGRPVASGLFPFDENCIYYWGGASWSKDKHLNPNELLHWTVIKEAVERGIPLYNLCGGRSRFKDKFGGEDTAHLTYYKSFLPGISRARNMYRSFHFRSLRIRGRIREIWSRMTPSK